MNFPATRAGGELARRIAELKFTPARERRADALAPSLAGQEDVRLLTPVFERFRDFADRQQARRARGERGNHCAGGAQNIEHHAGGVGQIIRAPAAVLCRCEQNSDFASHDARYKPRRLVRKLFPLVQTQIVKEVLLGVAPVRAEMRRGEFPQAC